GYLYDSNLNQLDSDSDSGEDANFRLSAWLSPGTYYVLVRGQYNTTVGGYVLHVEGPGAGTVSDDHGLSPWSATPIAVGSTTSGTILPPGDLDYFSFVAPNAATYVIYTAGSTDTYGELYDGLLNRVTYDSDSGAGANFQI